ncbi:MAG: TonB-dependent receptor, partial [Bacteroidetes bacterium]|nr:TonB-dependent receptor [Fibrella sp.]
EITLDADYTRFRNGSPSTITNHYFTAGQPVKQIGNVFDAQTGIAIVTLKGDLTKRWKATGTKLEGGFKRTNVNTDNDLRAFLITESGERPADDGRTNFFDYRELVNAGYASLTNQRGKWTLQAGLRAEQSRVQGQSVDLGRNTITRPDTSYVNLFPSAFVQYRAGETGQVNLNYGRRIQRPNYQDMNPFIYQIDPYTSQRGNPFLRPQYTHNLELSYTYKYATTLRISASRTADFFTDISHQEGVNTYMTVENAGRVDAVNVSVSSPVPITKWWNGYVYAGVTLNRYVAVLTDGPLDARAVAFDAYMQHSFTLPKAIALQISGFYNAPTQQTIFRTRGLGSLNLGVKKKVMKERGDVQLGVDDLLNTMRWSQSVDFQQQDYTLYRKWESRRVKLQLTYRFGKAKEGQSGKSIRDRETGDDAGRIKTKSAI